MLGWGLRQTSSNDSGGGRRTAGGLADGGRGGQGSGRAGGERGWPDDADYNNRDFRGLEIAARAFARSADTAADYVQLRCQRCSSKLLPAE
jgi:hypothetical protein